MLRGRHANRRIHQDIVVIETTRVLVLEPPQPPERGGQITHVVSEVASEALGEPFNPRPVKIRMDEQLAEANGGKREHRPQHEEVLVESRIKRRRDALDDMTERFAQCRCSNCSGYAFRMRRSVLVEVCEEPDSKAAAGASHQTDLGKLWVSVIPLGGMEEDRRVSNAAAQHSLMEDLHRK